MAGGSSVLFGSVALEEPRALAAEAASACGGPSDALERLSLAEEAAELAERLRKLAAAAAAVSTARPAPPPDCQSVGVCTELSGAEVAEWEEAGQLLGGVQAELERVRARTAAACTRRDEALAACASAKAEEQQWATEAEVWAAALPGLEVAQEAEAEARSRWEAEVLAETTAAEEEVNALRQSEAAHAAEDERTAAALWVEIREAEAETQQARAQEAELQGDAAELAAATSAAEALEEVEARADMLEEERARLQEELGTLRYSLKDMKSFQHRRVQELDAQVQKFEKQRRRLEAEQEKRIRSEQASEAAEAANAESQLLRLQQLNDRLTAQVEDAKREKRVREERQVELLAEKDRLLVQEERESEEFSEAHQQLDELAESEGALRREARHLKGQAQLLHRQVDQLDATASQTRLQLEEAEAAKGRLQDEKQAAERRAEITGWKVQVAETQLSGARTPHRVRAARVPPTTAREREAVPRGGETASDGSVAPAPGGASP